MDVRDLALKVEVSNYDLQFWFTDCALKGDILLVPNQSVGRFIANCWGPQMRAIIPGLTIRVVPPAEKPAKNSILNAKGRKWEQARQATQVRLTEVDE